MANPVLTGKPAHAPAAAAPNHVTCRICGRLLPAPFVDFGPMPLANSFLASLDEAPAEARYPLAAACCIACGLVQLNYVVPADQLYRNYIYVSSTSDAVRAHAARLAADLPARYGWTGSSTLVEVASNDGTVLKAFQQAGVGVLGVEPAVNIAAIAQAAGVPTVPEFFTEPTARMIRRKHPRAAGILGRHVFAHVNDLRDFLRGVDALLAEDGVLLIEVPYWGDLLRHNEFDTIYHEHLSYFALTPVARLCETNRFRLVDAEPVTLHGGSVLMHIRRASARVRPAPRLEEWLAREAAEGITSFQALQAFGASVALWRSRWTGMISRLQQEGAVLLGYGAAAKANTLLNVSPDAARALRWILDRSPHKQGRFTPGVHLPVKSVETWQGSGATHLVILAWNFRDEIMRQMQSFADAGGKFVVPIPRPEVISG